MEILKAHAAGMDDATVVTALLLVEGYIEASAIGSDERRAQLIIRCSLIETLEDRHPEAAAAMDEWALALDDPRSYSQALLDSIKGA